VYFAHQLPETDEARLWAEFREGNSAQARETLFLLHLPYAKTIAARLYGNRLHDDVEFADYFQFSTVGLLEALDRFDATRGVLFRTYCTRRIEGNILDGIAVLTEVQGQLAMRRRMRTERLGSFKSTDGKPSKDDPVGKLSEIAVGLAIGFMLQEGSMYRGDPEDAGPNLYETVAWRQSKQRLHGLLEELPVRERKVIGYHYIHGLAFEQVALLLGLSKGRVSQLHRRGLALMRERLGSVQNYSLTG